MICVFDPQNTNFESNGNAVLIPTEGKMKHVAGGSYSITMQHPIDADGKWTHLVEDAIIRIPVPEETIENAFTGYEAWVYTTTEQAYLRDGTEEPTAITYPAWNPNGTYQVGSKVTVAGRGNYQCVYYDASSGQTQVPPYNNSWWKKIASETSGSPALATLPAGTKLYWVEGSSGDAWWKMSTEYGIVGWIKQSELTFYKHMTPEETQPRVIRTQLFRIKKTTVDTKSNSVSVEAEHVSYDNGGNMVKEVAISQASPAMAIGRIIENLMMELRGEVATNLTAADNGTYTGTIKGKNLIYCLLDPDKGIGPTFDAAVKRDNWDIFLLKKTDTDRGFRLKRGRNLKGVNWSRDRTNRVTRVVPVAKDENGADLYLPNPFVDSRRILDYPVIKMERLAVSGQVGKDDGTGTDTTWTLQTLYQEMQTKAEERFTVDNADLSEIQVTVDFVALGNTAEFPELKKLEKALMYDIVTAEDDSIGLEIKLRVSEIEWDFIREKLTGIKLTNLNSYSQGTVTGYQVQNNSISAVKLTDEVTGDILQQVQDMIPEYSDQTGSSGSRMNSRTQNGFVEKGEGQANKVWKTDDDGNPAWRTPEGSTVNVVDNLYSTSATDALSANMGRVLNSNFSKLGNLHFAQGQLGAGLSVTITNVRIALVVIGRGTSSDTSTTAFVDRWGGIVYISKNTDYTITRSGDSMTLANGTGGAANYIVFSTDIG